MLGWSEDKPKNRILATSELPIFSMPMSGYSLLKHLVAVLILLLPAVFGPTVAAALEPDEILVVANRNAGRSIGLAKYYMKQRGIPEDRLVALWVTDGETCSRQDYDKKVVPPIRRWLAAHPGAGISCLVTVYGVPFKVAPPEMPNADKPKANKPSAPGKKAESTLKNGNSSDEGKPAPALPTPGASLDSELCLIKAGIYPLEGWQPNPFFIGYQGREVGIDRNDVLMVSRLDGPSSKIVRRIIDDSLAIEARGLVGTAYFDARWPRPTDDRPVEGYAFYDRSIHRASDRVEASGRMPVRRDDRQELFQPGDAPEAALYCGWYSLSRYVDAFTWQPGAVGFHIASGECSTLHNPESRIWCVQMLLKGAAAVIGPVDEPYVQAFPVPEIFFGVLVDGRLTLAECYMLSVPYLSWQMVLVGDPLYRPFGMAVAS
jgi:uncharacterized protein (TIGR03790 family)